MTKKDLVKVVAEKTGYTQKDITGVVDSVFEVITEAMKTEEVSIYGFGKFVVTDKAAREMRNPATGETIKVPAKKAPKFKAATALKESLN